MRDTTIPRRQIESYCGVTDVNKEECDYQSMDSALLSALDSAKFSPIGPCPRFLKNKRKKKALNSSERILYEMHRLQSLRVTRNAFVRFFKKIDKNPFCLCCQDVLVEISHSKTAMDDEVIFLPKRLFSSAFRNCMTEIEQSRLNLLKYKGQDPDASNLAKIVPKSLVEPHAGDDMFSRYHNYNPFANYKTSIEKQSEAKDSDKKATLRRGMNATREQNVLRSQTSSKSDVKIKPVPVRSVQVHSPQFATMGHTGSNANLVKLTPVQVEDGGVMKNSAQSNQDEQRTEQNVDEQSPFVQDNIHPHAAPLGYQIRMGDSRAANAEYGLGLAVLSAPIWIPLWIYCECEKHSYFVKEIEDMKNWFSSKCTVLKQKCSSVFEENKVNLLSVSPHSYEVEFEDESLFVHEQDAIRGLLDQYRNSIKYHREYSLPCGRLIFHGDLLEISNWLLGNTEWYTFDLLLLDNKGLLVNINNDLVSFIRTSRIVDEVMEDLRVKSYNFASHRR